MKIFLEVQVENKINLLLKLQEEAVYIYMHNP